LSAVFPPAKRSRSGCRIRASRDSGLDACAARLIFDAFGRRLSAFARFERPVGQIAMFNTKPSSVFQPNRPASASSRSGRSTASTSAPRRERGVILELFLRFFFFVWLIFKVAVLSAAVFGAATYVSYTVISRKIVSTEIPVPNVTGLPVAEAAKLLQQQGKDLDLKGRELSLKVDEYVLSNEVGEGQIVSQFPLDATIVKAGSVVRVKVSKGSALETVPDVRAKDVTDARTELLNAKLTEGDKTYLPHATFKRDTVIAQDPTPGEMLQKGASVHLLVSAGGMADLRIMPDLMGQPNDRASTLLAKAGLFGEIVKEEVSAEGTPGVIVSQSPVAGALAPRDMRIQIKVRKTDAPAPAGEPTPDPQLAPPENTAGKSNDQ
jgi:beta-lactam-binding protein with PASTA domain